MVSAVLDCSMPEVVGYDAIGKDVVTLWECQWRLALEHGTSGNHDF